MPPDPPRGKGPYGPFSGHSRLLNLQWPLITNVIETPVTELLYQEIIFFYHVNCQGVWILEEFFWVLEHLKHFYPGIQ